MDIKKYFDGVQKYIDSLTDDEFIALMKECGIDKCPLLDLEDENNNIPDLCKGCPNHPINGGSGICHCTLGSNITN